MGRLVRTLVLVAAGVACLATPAARQQRAFPAWEVEGTSRLAAGCAHLDAWISKSGKEGAGVSVIATSTGQERCEVEWVQAQFRAGPMTVNALRLPERHLANGEPVYLGFAFDNERLWNEEHRTGELSLSLKVQGEAFRWVLPVRHLLRGYHTERR